MKTLHLAIIVGGILLGMTAFFFTIFYEPPVSKENDYGITALVIYRPVGGCPMKMCVHPDYYLKINSKANMYLHGYAICNGILCVKNEDGLSILLPVSDVLYPQYAYVPLSYTVPWKTGDTVEIQVEVSTNYENESASTSPFWIDLGKKEVVLSS